MAQITFQYKSLEINVSSHGYFIIYTDKIPTWKWSKIGGILEHGEIDKIGGKYISENDDVEPDIEKLENSAIEYLKINHDRLKVLEDIEVKKWNDKQGSKVAGLDVCIGDFVKFEGEQKGFYLLGVDGNSVDGKNEDGSLFATGLNNRKIIKIN